MENINRLLESMSDEEKEKFFLNLSDDLTPDQWKQLELILYIEQEQVDCVKNEIEPAKRQVSYALDRIHQMEQERKGNDKPVFSVVEAIFDFMLNWGLVRFPSERLESPNQKSKPVNYFAMFLNAKTALLVAYVVTLVVLLHEPKNFPESSRKYLAQITTGTESRIIPLTKSVVASAKNNTSINILSESKIELHKGSVWLDVEKEGKDFEIQTDFGLITVTGTSFGVFHVANQIVVEVSEGSVVIAQGEESRTLNVGAKLALNVQGFGEILPREQGSNKPVWVQDLQREEWLAALESLVAYWNMESFSELGYLVDSGPFKMHGQVISEKRPNSSPSDLSEIFGQQLSMNLMDFVTIDLQNSEGMDQLNHKFTLMAWVNRKEHIEYNRIIASIGRGWRWGFVDQKLSFEFYPEDSTQIQDSKMYETDISDIMKVDEWTHVACIVDIPGKEIVHTINGKIVERLSINEQINLQPKALWRIGSGLQKLDENKSSSFNGSLDEVRIYNKALAIEDIQKISKIDIFRKGGQN